MRVLLATNGSRDDVEPIVPPAMRLRAPGADAVCSAPPEHGFQRLVAGGRAPAPSRKPWNSGATDASAANAEMPHADPCVRGHIGATRSVMRQAAEGCVLIVASGKAQATASSPDTRARALAVAARMATDGTAVVARQPIRATPS